jgi:hypothetical protein
MMPCDYAGALYIFLLGIWSDSMLHMLHFVADYGVVVTYCSWIWLQLCDD